MDIFYTINILNENMKPDFKLVTKKIAETVEEWEIILIELSDDVITSSRNQQNRNIKQILGHLVDSASNNHQRMVRLQYNPELIFPDYQQDNDLWIALQNYENADWFNLVQLWKYYNLHIIQVIESVDFSKLDAVWHNFEGEPVTLQQMIEGYNWHLTLHINEIKELIGFSS